jgi:hypothetical protein
MAGPEMEIDAGRCSLLISSGIFFFIKRFAIFDAVTVVPNKGYK